MESKNPVTAHYSPDLVTHHDQLSAASEAFKITRTNIEFSAIGSKIRSLMVTSTNQTEGKTVTLANLAITYAQLGRRVLLVDADLRRPAVHRYFGYINRRGLTNVLIGAGHYSEYILPTLTENLSLLPSGPIPPNPADLLMSQTMSDLIEVLTAEYDLVLFDCPPVGVVTDAAIVATKVDASIFVVRSGVATRAQIRRAASLLEQVNARVLGFIMNGINEESEDYYYYYYQHAYYTDDSADLREKGLFKKKRRGPARTPHTARTMAAAPLVRQPTVPVRENGSTPQRVIWPSNLNSTAGIASNAGVAATTNPTNTPNATTTTPHTAQAAQTTIASSAGVTAPTPTNTGKGLVSEDD